MTTLKDFLELDSSICGLDIDVRRNGGLLVEVHRYGEGAWAGNERMKVEENVYREFGGSQIYIYLHPEPINLVQTGKDHWGVIKSRIPNRLLKMEIWRIAPYTAGFLHKQNNGTYYSIDLKIDNPETYETPVMKAETETNNITFDELLGG